MQQILEQNNMTMDALEKELREKYGMGLTKFKTQLRSQIQEQLIKQKVSQQYVGQVSVSKNDVENVFPGLQRQPAHHRRERAVV